MLSEQQHWFILPVFEPLTDDLLARRILPDFNEWRIYRCDPTSAKPDFSRALLRSACPGATALFIRELSEICRNASRFVLSLPMMPHSEQEWAVFPLVPMPDEPGRGILPYAVGGKLDLPGLHDRLSRRLTSGPETADLAPLHDLRDALARQGI